MLVVIGSSAKGLGASGITIDDEIDRLNRMIKKAKELGIQIVAAQIEGKARRDREGGPNERSIDAIAPYADYIIIKDDADFDGKFTKISQENNIPMTVIEDTVEFTEVIKAMYSKAD
jgi:sugar/nucleoside kinase (ribokinase family)